MSIKLMLLKIVQENRDKPDFYIRNLLREYLQVVVLNYLYSSENYRSLFFYGGTCLSHCYGLPRLSEDLDFVDVSGEVDVKSLAKDLEDFFNKNFDVPVKVKVQKFRIYLKFQVLKDLGLSEASESEQLFVKVEVFSGFDFCADYKEEFKPIFKFNYSVLVKTFDISTLMATKIRAVLYRKWRKTDKAGEDLIEVKGRDFFDLMWFLEKGVEPNLKCIEDIEEKEDLKKKLLDRIEETDPRSIGLDLQNFIAKENFSMKGEDIKKALTVGIERM